MDNAPCVHNFTVGLGGRDVPLEIYREIHAAVRDRSGIPFAILDLEPDRLPVEPG